MYIIIFNTHEQFLKRNGMHPVEFKLHLMYVFILGCDFLVLWLDCDREGENIAFEVIDIVAPVMSGSRKLGGGILRAKFRYKIIHTYTPCIPCLLCGV